MAHEITAREIAEWFTSRDLPVPEATVSALENEKADNAFHVVEKKLNPTIKGAGRTKSADQWQKRLFDLAAGVESDFTFEITGQQGRGNSQVVRRQVSIETDKGTLLVKLTRPHVPEEAK